MSADRIRPGEPTGKTACAFGDQLRRAREARGLTLEAVSEGTRIGLRHLDALERSDLGALPAGPFGRGYVRTYAKLLGIDPEPILEAYRVHEAQQGLGAGQDEQQVLEQLSRLVDKRVGTRGDAPTSPLRAGRAVLACVLLGILGALGWFLIPGRIPRTTPASPPPQPPRPATETVEASGPAPASAAAGRTTARPPSAALPTDALQVSDHAVGTDLVDRRLVGRADRFPEETRVAYWTVVLGGQPGHVIRHVWFQQERAVMRADLPIGGPHWRTYSRLLLPRGSAGRWTVEARTSDGRLLARDEFLCEPGRP